MRSEYVSPFAQAGSAAVKNILGVEASRGALSVHPVAKTTQQLNIVFRISGSIEGLVIYGMSMITADRIAGRMIGSPVVTFDQVAASALSELGNMISGAAATMLAAQGYPSVITPPSIIRGTNVRIGPNDLKTLIIPFNLPGLGTLEVNAALRECRQAAA